MKDDVRYSELVFLSNLNKNPLKYINVNSQEEHAMVGLPQTPYAEMIIDLLENSYIKPNQSVIENLARQLYGETHRSPYIAREEIFNKFISGFYQFRITYKGLRRIEELRDLLKRERIFEPFGILLDSRYFIPDCNDALHRESTIPVSVLRMDMDGFKRVNEEFGHAAGDEVMKCYLGTVQECLGTLGTAYRGRGDEVMALIVGQGHEKSISIAEEIRGRVKAMQCEHKGKGLPGVTVSIGVATSPPEKRTVDIEILADERQRRAKIERKDRVIAS